jgi:hypothetical protein
MAKNCLLVWRKRRQTKREQEEAVEKVQGEIIIYLFSFEKCERRAKALCSFGRSQLVLIKHDVITYYFPGGWTMQGHTPEQTVKISSTNNSHSNAYIVQLKTL